MRSSICQKCRQSAYLVRLSSAPREWIHNPQLGHPAQPHWWDKFKGGWDTMPDPTKPPEQEITVAVFWEALKHTGRQLRRNFFKPKRWRLYRVVYNTFAGSFFWFLMGSWTRAWMEWWGIVYAVLAWGALAFVMYCWMHYLEVSQERETETTP